MVVLSNCNLQWILAEFILPFSRHPKLSLYNSYTMCPTQGHNSRERDRCSGGLGWPALWRAPNGGSWNQIPFGHLGKIPLGINVLLLELLLEFFFNTVFGWKTLLFGPQKKTLTALCPMEEILQGNQVSQSWFTCPTSCTVQWKGLHAHLKWLLWPSQHFIFWPLLPNMSNHRILHI